MLHQYCSQFLEYCQLADFSVRSIQALTIRLNEFKAFLKSQRIRSVKKITYQHLINFVADHKDPSIHVRKSRSLGSGHSNILKNLEKIPKNTSISVLIDQFSCKNWLIKDGGR